MPDMTCSQLYHVLAVCIRQKMPVDKRGGGSVCCVGEFDGRLWRAGGLAVGQAMLPRRRGAVCVKPLHHGTHKFNALLAGHGRPEMYSTHTYIYIYTTPRLQCGNCNSHKPLKEICRGREGERKGIKTEERRGAYELLEPFKHGGSSSGRVSNTEPCK